MNTEKNTIWNMFNKLREAPEALKIGVEELLGQIKSKFRIFGISAMISAGALSCVEENVLEQETTSPIESSELATEPATKLRIDAITQLKDGILLWFSDAVDTPKHLNAEYFDVDGKVLGSDLYVTDDEGQVKITTPNNTSKTKLTDVNTNTSNVI